MNKIFRLIWCTTRQAWVAVAEHARGRSRQGSTRRLRRNRASVALAALATGSTLAAVPAPGQLPDGGQVVAGTARIGVAGAVMNVDQRSNRAIIEWNSFDLGSAAQINFNQPDRSSATLNRVLDSNPSQIFGRISAPGAVFLVNPNGVYFAPGAQVDVGALVASTHAIGTDDFMAGNLRFERDGASGAVVNAGELKAALGGYIALLAPEVRNEGVIVAQAGSVAMAAGEAITLNFGANNTLAGLTVSPSQFKSLVENRHAVLAPDGLIVLSARAVDSLQGGVVRNSGSLAADSLTARGGRIVLEGDEIGLAAGSLLSARGADGGGTVLVGGDWQGSGALHQARQVVMAAGAAIDASATGQGDGGKVVLWSDVQQAAGQTSVAGSIVARGAAGGQGGQVETSGHALAVSADAAVTTGAGGLWLLDPADITISSAAAASSTNGGGVITPDSGVNSATVNAGTLATALGSGDVTVTTSNSGTAGAGIGDLTITSNIAKTGSTDSTLTLKAHRDITFYGAGITSTNSKLNLVLISDQDNSAGGAVYFNGNITAITVDTHGGHLWAGGNSLGTAFGSSSWNGLTVGTGAASATATTGVWEGLQVYRVALTTGGGSVYLKGFNSRYNSGEDRYGVKIANSSNINTGAGSLTVDGGLLQRVGALAVLPVIYGVSIADSTLQTTTGNISLDGHELPTEGSNNAGGYGLRLYNSSTKSTSGSITLSGTTGTDSGGANMRHGVLLDADGAGKTTEVSSVSGNISITGTANVTSNANSAGIALRSHQATNTDANNPVLKVVSQTGNVSLTGDTPANSNVASSGVAFDGVNYGKFFLGYDGSNAYSGTTTITGRSLSEANVNAGYLNIGGSGALTIAPLGASFIVGASTAQNLDFNSHYNFGTSHSSVTLGKLSNTGNVTLSSALSVAGGINIYGGELALNAALTSSGTGDINLIGNSATSVGIIANSSGTINKTGGGDATLTVRSNGRVGLGAAITDTSTSGKLNTVLWVNYGNTVNYGVSGVPAITTKGGHLWVGGSSTANGSAVWNGLTVGDGAARGTSAGTINAIDLKGAIDTSNGAAGGDVYLWGGTSGGVSLNGVGAAPSISAGNGNLTLRANTVSWITPFGITTTGAFTLWSASGTMTSDTGSLGQNTDFGYFRFNAIPSSITWGGPGNLQPITVGASGNTTVTAAGPISIYGGAINVGTNLVSTASGAGILIKANGNLTMAASQTIKTNGGDITLWSDSDAAGGGYIVLNNSSTLDSRTDADRSASKISNASGGGTITVAGGSTSTTLLSGTVVPTGYALNSGTSVTSGVTFGNLANSGIKVYSGGGDIAVKGEATNGNTGLASGITAYEGLTMNAGSSGNLTLTGYVHANLGTIAGIDLDAYRAGSAATTLQTANGNLTLNGTAGDGIFTTVAVRSGAYSSQPITLAATGSGAVSINGNVTTGNGRNIMRLAGTNVLAASGLITLSGVGTSGLDAYSDNGNYVNTIGSKSGSPVTSSTSNVLITADSFSLAASNGLQINTSGNLTVQPASTSFSSALSWPMSNFGLAGTVSGLTLGKSGNSADISIASATTIAGPISIYGGNIAVNAALAATGSTLSLTGTGNVTDGAGGSVTAAQLALLGGTVVLDSTANDVATLAASGVSGLSYVDSNALSIGTVGGTVGVNASGVVSIGTQTGDLTVSANTATSNATASALTLNAGVAAAAGTASGGNLLISGTPTVQVGAGGTASLYSGSVAGSTGLTALIGAGSGRFRYASDESSSAYTTPLATGRNAIYREAFSTSVVADSQTISYGGSVTPTGTSSGTVNGDTGSYALSGAQLSGAGYLKAGSYTLTASGSGLVGLGYTVTPTVNGTLTVNPRLLTLSNFDAGSKSYDGTTTATIYNAGSLLGVSGGDVVTLSNSGASFADSNAGTAKTVTLNGVLLGGADAANYSLASSATDTADITPAIVTIGALAASDKTYDGSTSVVMGNWGTLSGLIGAETLTLNHTSASFADANAGSGKTVTASGYSLSNGTGSASNYVLGATSATTTASIAPAPLSISGVSASDKTYDGTAAASISDWGTLTGLVNGETLVLNHGSASFANPNTGNGKTVTASGYSVSNGSGAAGNYVLGSSTASATASITPAALTMTAQDSAKALTDADPALSAIYTGFVHGETASVLSGVSVTRAAGETAGNYVLTPSASAANYTITPVTGTFTIAPADRLVVVVDNVAQQYGAVTPGFNVISAKYYSTSNSQLVNVTDITHTGNQFVLDDQLGTVTSLTLATTAPQTSGSGNLKVGNYAIGGTNVSTSGTGLNYNSYQIVSGNQLVNPIALTPSASGVSKVYDGSTAMSGVSLSVAGALGGDAVSASGTGAFASKHAGSNLAYSLSGVSLNGADAANYYLNGGSSFAGSDGSITPRTLSVSYTGVNKTYDGTPAASVTTTDNRLGSDVLTIQRSAAFANKNVGTAKAVTVTGVTLSGADAANYTVAAGGASTADIAAAPLTVSGVTASAKVYDGNTTASVDISHAVYAGLVGGDDVGLAATGSFVDKNAGTAKAVLLSSSYAGSDAGNYVITSQSSTSADISAKALTASAAGGISKSYDGTTAMTGVSIALTGKVGSDDVTVSGSGAFGAKDAGNNLSYTLSNLALGGTDAGNYYLNGGSNFSGSDGVITPRTLQVVFNGVDKIYDGNNSASVGVSDDHLGSDVLNILRSASFPDKQVGNGKLVNVSGVSLSGADAGNYTVAASGSTSASISPRALEVSGLNALAKVYDGSTMATVDSSAAILSGLVVGDAVNVSATGQFADKHVGSGKSVILVSSYGGADVANYLITGQASSSAAITPKPVTLTASGTLSKVYDGNTAIESLAIGVDGTVAGDQISATGSGNFASKNAGNGLAYNISTIVLAGADAGNYSAAAGSGVAGSNGSISPRPLNVSFSGIAKVYDGLLSASVSSSDDRIVGDVLNVLSSAAFVDKNVGNAKPVNVSAVSLGGADAGNYTVAASGITSAAITPRALTVSGLTAASKEYDGATAAIVDASGATLHGLVAGDVVSVDAGGNFFDKNVGHAKTVSLYSSLGGSDAGNYSIDGQGEAQADITPKPLLVSGITALSKVYDGSTAASATTAHAVLTGLVAGDAITLTASGSFHEKHVGNGKLVSLESQYGGADLANYAIRDQASARADITPRALTLAALSDNKVYDGTSTSSKLPEASGLVSGDSVTARQAFDSSQAGARTLSVSEGYTINDGNGGRDYTVTLREASGSITAVLIPPLPSVTPETGSGSGSGIGSGAGAAIGTGIGSIGDADPGTGLDGGNASPGAGVPEAPTGAGEPTGAATVPGNSAEAGADGRSKTSGGNPASDISVNLLRTPESTTEGMVVVLIAPEFLVRNTGFSFALPEAMTAESATYPLSVTLSDGKPLPAGVSYNPVTQRIEASAVFSGGLPLQVAVTVGPKRWLVLISERVSNAE